MGPNPRDNAPMSNDTTPDHPADHPEDDALNEAPPNHPDLLDPATWRLFAWVRSFVRSGGKGGF